MSQTDLVTEIEAGLITGQRLAELFRGMIFEIKVLKAKIDTLERELNELDRAECNW